MGLDVVTGASGYTGRYITRRLLDAGREVRTLTGHPGRPMPFAEPIEVLAYRFDDEAELARSMEGASTLYNTYWVRFGWRGRGFDEAVENSLELFRAARRAGVERIVHVSITNPSLDSRLPYFRGKAIVERGLEQSGVAWSVIRPTVVFGLEDIMVNNIAWLLRRVPLFALPRRGAPRVRPVFVDDVARLCVEAAGGANGSVVDALGPEVFTFRSMVETIRAAVGSRSRLVPLPSAAVTGLARMIGLAVQDVLLTPQELAGLLAGLVTSDGPTTGRTSFSDWVAANGDQLGRRYASELARHFRAA